MLIRKYACILSRTLLAMSQIFYYIEVDIINILLSHLIIYLKYICLCDINVIVDIIHFTYNHPFYLFIYLFIYKYVIIFQ